MRGSAIYSGRLDDLVAALQTAVSVEAAALRLCQRLRRTGDSIFNFPEHPSNPFENNVAERVIRPAVVLPDRIIADR